MDSTVDVDLFEDAAFACDPKGRLVLWNLAVEQLLGHSSEAALGRPCNEILSGIDVFGNPYCSESCPIRRFLRNDRPVRDFEMTVRTRSGKRLHANVSVLKLRGANASASTLLHVLRPIRTPTAWRGVDRVAVDSQAPSTSRSPLTPRENQVLRLVVEGMSTGEIAESLFISRATARAHIQHILHKLDVHSRVEAVTRALREHLV